MKSSSGVSPAEGQSREETGHLAIGTAIDEIKCWATALAVGSVKLQSSARGSGKLTGLAARD